jgi:hypothetical protein
MFKFSPLPRLFLAAAGLCKTRANHFLLLAKFSKYELFGFPFRLKSFIVLNKNVMFSKSCIYRGKKRGGRSQGLSFQIVEKK